MSRRRPTSGASRRLRRTALVLAPALALVVIVAVAAAVAVLLLGNLPEGDQTAAVAPVLVALVVAAVGFAPLHRRVRAALLRAVRGERLLPEEAIDRFGDRATRGLPLEELLRQLAEALHATLALESVQVWTSAGPHLELAMAVPSRPPRPLVLGSVQVDALVRTSSAGPAWLELWAPDLLDGPAAAAPPTRVVPAVHSDALVGLVAVRRAAGAVPFDDADDRALVELGRRLGVVLHNRELDAALQATLEDLRDTNAELRASRMRLVATSDSERRRIERDLHDGAQQHLVALAVNARLARDAIVDDPEGAAQLLDALSSDLRTAVQEVRALAHGIYPPLLIDSGVAVALRAAAQRSPLPVEISGDVGRFAAESEAAVYFCCLEALQNVAKHGPGSSVAIELRRDEAGGAPDGGAVHFLVSDQGPGFDPATTPAGHGLQNMADRAGALGGSVAWHSSPRPGNRRRGLGSRRGATVNRGPEHALARGAVAAVARTELRRHWARLLVVGLAAGLLGSAVVGVAVVARRTATAYDRLATATDMEDAAASVFGDPALAEEVRALPGVTGSSVSTMFVGGVTGPGVIYLAVRSSPPDALGRPAIVAGRSPDPAAADEVVLLDDLAGALDMGVGSSLELCLLTSEEFASFDTGFGAPDGPCPTLRVVGIGRAAGTDTSTGIFAGPAFAERYGAGTRAGTTVDLRLDDAGAGPSAVSAAVDELAAANPIGEGAEEFPSVALSTPDERRDAAATTAQVLVGGLLACAAVAALVGLLLIGQALGRQFEADAADQQTEAALGMTPAERCLARVLPASVTAAIAAAVTFGGALAAGAIEPLGPLGGLEPSPGWAPNLGGALVGAVVVAAAALALAALAAWRAGRTATSSTVGARSARGSRLALVGGATTSAGLSLALGRGRGPGRLPVRATLATVVVGVAGVTAALTFAASLDRLGGEPTRWGWTSDVIVVDARAETVAEIAADPRVGATSWLHQVEGSLDGSAATLYAFEEGGAADPGWTILDGRPAVGPDEILLGPKLAGSLGIGVGEEVDLALLGGGARALHVVGVGLGSTMGQEGFGNAALVTPEALEGADVTGEFDELLVRAAPGADVEGLVADLAVEHELSTPSPPAPVQDVLDLDRIPDLLAAYLAFVALAALANGLAVVVRRRSRDLATLRAIGLTPMQVVGAVLSAALATAAIGLVVGVPVGLGLGRLVWWLVADRVGLATDVLVPVAEILLVVVGALVVAVAASVVPALRAVRLRPGVLLRAE